MRIFIIILVQMKIRYFGVYFLCNAKHKHTKMKYNLPAESFIGNNENAENTTKTSQFLFALTKHKTFYGISN